MTGSLPAFLLALAVAIAILLKRSYRYFGRRSKNAPPLVTIPRPSTANRKYSQVPAEWAKYEVELHETARQLSARLDSKMIALDDMTRRAQHVLDRLEALLVELNGLPENTPAREPAAVPDRAAVELDPEQAEIYALADHGYSEVTIAHRAGVSLGRVREVLAARASG